MKTKNSSHRLFFIHRWDLLVALYIFCVMVSELMGSKTFPLLTAPISLNASVAIFALPLIFTINDVIIEVYGRERAKSVIRASLVIVFLVMLASLLFTALPPSKRFAESEAAYDSIFGKSARFAAASLIAFAISEFTDIYIFSLLRERMRRKALWLRNNVSNFIAQFFDTLIFITLAFYALNNPFEDNVLFLWSLILPYWLLKCALSIVQTPLVYWGVGWLKKEKEGEL